jgi:hypothetical protein
LIGCCKHCILFIFFLFSFSSILARIFDKHFVILFYKFFYWGASTNIIINLTLKPHPKTLPHPTLTINIYLYSYESVSGLCGSEIYCVFRTLLCVLELKCVFFKLYCVFLIHCVSKHLSQVIYLE